MVEKTTLTRRIDVRLRSLRERLEALPWYAERFCTATGLDQSQRADWIALEAEWRDGLDRFDWMHAWFLAGDLSAEQAEKHRQNLALLAESVPLLHQLKIALPKKRRWHAGSRSTPGPGRSPSRHSI
jgi:hypothetical protein